jgi:hypothetical protein
VASTNGFPDAVELESVHVQGGDALQGPPLVARIEGLYERVFELTKAALVEAKPQRPAQSSSEL